DDRGTGWDNWYRQLDKSGGAVTVDGVSYPQNVDAATIDHFIDEEVATGKVDTRRIYVTGWSNGAAMGFLYALSRRRIAAAAVVLDAEHARLLPHASAPWTSLAVRPSSPLERAIDEGGHGGEHLPAVRLVQHLVPCAPVDDRLEALAPDSLHRRASFRQRC